MVKYSDLRMDRVFGALADGTRRRILERLARGEARVNQLAQPFQMSLPAISKHLGVLEDAGLISRTKDGRFRRCALRPEPLKSASEWIDTYRAFWEKQFDSLAQYLSETENSG